MKSIRIPQAFYVDHCERDLPAPQIDYRTKTHIYVFDGDGMADLIADAEFYADAKATDAPAHIKQAAGHLLRAIERGRQ